MVLLGWLDLLYLYYVLSSLTDLTYICIQQFTQCFRCFCYRCFCLSIKSLYAEGLNGMLEKCVNTSFFPSRNRHSGQCVIMLALSWQMHNFLGLRSPWYPLDVSLSRRTLWMPSKSYLVHSLVSYRDVSLSLL